MVQLCSVQSHYISVFLPSHFISVAYLEITSSDKVIIHGFPAQTVPGCFLVCCNYAGYPLHLQVLGKPARLLACAGMDE
jgi:hypothetical protein